MGNGDERRGVDSRRRHREGDGARLSGRSSHTARTRSRFSNAARQRGCSADPGRASDRHSGRARGACRGRCGRSSPNARSRRTASTAGALRLAENCNANVDRDADEASRSSGLLITLSLAKDGSAYVDRDRNERAALSIVSALGALGGTKSSNAGIDRHIDKAAGATRTSLLITLGLPEDASADVDRNRDQRAVGAILSVTPRALLALGLTKSSDAGVDGHRDETIGPSLLLALCFAENAEAEVDGEGDQRLLGTVFAATGGLRAMRLTEDCETGIDRYRDEPTGRWCLLVASGLAEHRGAERNGNVNETSGLNCWFHVHVMERCVLTAACWAAIRPMAMVLVLNLIFFFPFEPVVKPVG